MPDAAPMRDSVVTLREITNENLFAVYSLRVGIHQDRYVAPNGWSLCQAAQVDYGWPRAVYADDTAVGFLMLAHNPQDPEPWLWRFMIDRRWQGLGFGRRALALAVEHLRADGTFTHMRTSTVPGEHGPRRFYERCGFTFTGWIDGGEEVHELRFDGQPVQRLASDGKSLDAGATSDAPGDDARAVKPSAATPGSDFYCEQALSGATPVTVVRETADVLAFHHTRPHWPVHVVVVPKRHVPSLTDLGADRDAEHLLHAVLAVTRQVAAEIAAEHGAARVLTNLGAYQDSKHLHFHVCSGEPLG